MYKCNNIQNFREVKIKVMLFCFFFFSLTNDVIINNENFRIFYFSLLYSILVEIFVFFTLKYGEKCFSSK